MKRLFFLCALLLFCYVLYNRERVYVRDPLAHVTRNGAKEAGAQVYINYTNDVLLENDNAPAYVTLVQHHHAIGVPAQLHCIHWLVCETDAADASLVSVDDHAVLGDMTSQRVTFTDEEGRETVVSLR